MTRMAKPESLRLQLRDCMTVNDFRRNEKGKETIFPDLLLIKYENSKIDDMIRARRYIKWCKENNIPLDYGSTSVPPHALAPRRILNSMLNEWILDSFDMEADFARTHNDPYSRSLHEYKAVFDNEIEQLANKYELRIRKKEYVLDNIWEKCEQVYGGTLYSWHDDGFE
ncbi:hypothetical protein Tco_1494572 [Tanacetum coccineum]